MIWKIPLWRCGDTASISGHVPAVPLHGWVHHSKLENSYFHFISTALYFINTYSVTQYIILGLHFCLSNWNYALKKRAALLVKMQAEWVKALKGEHASVALFSALQRRLGIRRQKGLTWWQWYMMMASVYVASSKWAVSHQAGAAGASGRRTHRCSKQPLPQMSRLGVVVSREGCTSPTRGNVLFLEIPVSSQSMRKTNWFCVQLKRKGRGTLPVVQWLWLYLPMHGVSVRSLVRSSDLHIPLGHGTEAALTIQ